MRCCSTFNSREKALSLIKLIVCLVSFCYNKIRYTNVGLQKDGQIARQYNLAKVFLQLEKFRISNEFQKWPLRVNHTSCILPVSQLHCICLVLVYLACSSWMSLKYLYINMYWYYSFLVLCLLLMSYINTSICLYIGVSIGLLTYKL